MTHMVCVKIPPLSHVISLVLQQLICFDFLFCVPYTLSYQFAFGVVWIP